MTTKRKNTVTKYHTAIEILFSTVGDDFVQFDTAKFCAEYHLSQQLPVALQQHGFIQRCPERRGYIRIIKRQITIDETTEIVQTMMERINKIKPNETDTNETKTRIRRKTIIERPRAGLFIRIWQYFFYNPYKHA